MNAVDIIRSKRDGRQNSAEEIRYLVGGAVRDEIPSYQVSAWLMAVFLRGLSPLEQAELTEALVGSGSVVDLSDIDGFKVDKHSTGGVGDKTSLIVAPIVAAAGALVPMMSGRGLGHTGGTLDKLESIPGFRVNLDLEEFRSVLRRHGMAMIGQTEDVVPGDRILYALRDVTATVESIPLIVASIISKKVAEGTQGLVLDVKTGCGAFMKNSQDAEHLARELVDAGSRLGLKTVALITDMSQPLGRKVGNALEVVEALETLRGEGPADLTAVSLELSAHMLLMAGIGEDLDESRRISRDQIENGTALEKFADLISAQGGNAGIVSDPGLLPYSPHVFEYTAPGSGVLQEARADDIGRAAMLLGAGRSSLESTINPAVGIEVLLQIGDPVEEGQPLARIIHDDAPSMERAREILSEALRVGPQRVEPPQLFLKVIG